MKKSLRLLPVLLLCALCFCACASAAVLTVDGSGQGDYAALTEAVAAAAPGDELLIRAGVYDGESENFPLVIDKPLTLRGEEGAVLDSPMFTTLIEVKSDGVTVEGLELRVRKWGIVADLSSGLTVRDCRFVLAEEKCRTSSTAIWLRGMKHCTFEGCAFDGVSICAAGDPLTEASKTRTVLTGLCEVGEDTEYFTTHTFTDNLVNGKPLYYIHSETDAVIPSDAGGVICACCDGVTFSDADVSDSSMGFEIVYCTRVRVTNVTADRCGIFGTYTAKCSDVILEGLHVRNSNHAIDTRDCDGAVVRGCEALDSDQGIFFSRCRNYVSEDCLVEGCGFGYFAAVGNDALIRRCVMRSNADGIYLQNENDTLITDCEITDNHVVGLRVLKASCRAESVNLTGNWTGVILFESGNVTMDDCTVAGSGAAGVFFKTASHIMLSRCALRDQVHLETDGSVENVWLYGCALTGERGSGTRFKGGEPMEVDCVWNAE